MELLDIPAADAIPIDRFDSQAAFVNRVGVVEGTGGVVVIHLGAGGVVGRHPAVRTQLFVVVHGSGFVSGDDGNEAPIAFGQAALWQAGESHESRSDVGMTAVVVEIDQVRPVH